MNKRVHVEPKEFTRSDVNAIEREDSSTKGTFTAVLASNGEASDGHILHIKGNKNPAKMSLLFGHRSEAMVPSLGNITKGTKGKSADGKLDVLRTTQTINMDGDGQMADIRRNIALLVDNGDLNGMSVRWVPDEVVRRIDLPKSHYAHVDASDEPRDNERYWGFFHKKSHNEEGSVVAIGADPAALVGRAQELAGNPSAIFFKVLARSIETNERSDGMAEISTAFASYSEALANLRGAGLCDEDLATIVSSDLNAADMIIYNFLDDGGNQQSMMVPRILRDSLLRESSEAWMSAGRLNVETLEAKATITIEHEERSDDDDLSLEELDALLDRKNKNRAKKKRETLPHVRTLNDVPPEELYRQLGLTITEQMRKAVAQATGKVLD